jgi:hypothetical protein
VAYLLTAVLVLSLLFGYGWSEPAYAATGQDGGEIATLDADGSGGEKPVVPAYFIGSSFDSSNASRDGMKAMRLNSSAALNAASHSIMIMRGRCRE